MINASQDGAGDGVDSGADSAVTPMADDDNRGVVGSEPWTLLSTSESDNAPVIEVQRAGPMSSIQDAGRPGLRGLGITAAGAIDPMSLALANLLVGNPRDAAAIEISLPPARLRFGQATRIALTGADVIAELDDGTRLLPWWSYPVRAGQVLSLRPSPTPGNVGLHSYLAVAGGIAVEPVLGSRSTDLKSGFGGFQGRLLVNGDELPMVPLARPTQAGDRNNDGVLLRRPFGIRSPSWFWPRHDFGHQAGPTTGNKAQAVEVRFLPGPEWEDFSLVSRKLLSTETWEVSARSNRMGYRLNGPTLLRLKAKERDLLSHGVLPGVIQVPPDGQPIVLLADAQTTGGYPKIGVVISADLPVMAQIRFGSKLRFVPCEPEAARQAIRDAARYLDEMAGAIGERLLMASART